MFQDVNFDSLAAEKHGWSYDASNQHFIPAPLSSTMVTPIYAHGM
jgi:hypothetical protein